MATEQTENKEVRQKSQGEEAASGPSPKPSSSDTPLSDEAERLIGEIAQGMPTREEMRSGHPAAVRKNMRWQSEKCSAIRRYEELRRELPKLPSIESLRL